MIIFPAIDLLDGKCVRLYKGEYQTKQVVAEDALSTALNFKKQGATWLHTVDLNGAKGEIGKNFDIIKTLARKSGLNVQSGGGIRTLDTAVKYIEAGVKRVILGSAAIKNPKLVEECIKELTAEAVAVGIDAKGGYVRTDGWLDDSGVHYIELAKQMAGMGVKYIIFTDISRDGTLQGANIEMLKELSRSADCDIIASGGVRDISDIAALKELDLYGAICGKAIYSGDLDLKQAIGTANK